MSNSLTHRQLIESRTSCSSSNDPVLAGCVASPYVVDVSTTYVRVRFYKAADWPPAAPAGAPYVHVRLRWMISMECNNRCTINHHRRRRRALLH